MMLKRLISAVLVAVMLICAYALADVVTTGDVNLRSGPGTNYSIIATISEGERLAYLGDNGSGSWYNVEYEGMEGWISAKYADIVDDLLPVAPQPEEEPEQPAAVVREVSVFWNQDLDTAAQMIGLNGYQESLMKPSKKYFDDNLTIAGDEKVELMVLLGSKYTILGASVGQHVSSAAESIVKRGMVFAGSEPGSVTFNFARNNVEGYTGSTLTLYATENIITSIEWTAGEN